MAIRLGVFRPIAFLLISGLLFSLGASVSLASIDDADPVGWQDLALYGGQIYVIAIDPVEPDTMFAGSYYGDGLFRSTDGGVTWQSVEGSLRPGSPPTPVRQPFP